MATCIFARDNVDEEVEHVRFGEGGGYVGALEGASFVVLGVDPGAHGELCDEDVAAFGEEYGGFGGDHLNLGVSLHDLLDPGQRKLVDLEIMVVGLEMVDCLLPVGGQNLARGACQALVDLESGQYRADGRSKRTHVLP